MRIVFRNYDQDQLEQQFRLDQVDNLQELFTLREKISRQARASHRCQTDISYAEGKHRTLDVFSNPEKPNNGAVQIFIHGGFWHSLDAKVFSFISNGFCPDGSVTVVIDYPLFPDADFQEILQSCQRAIKWVYENADSLDIDRKRIHISGNSAGGHLVTLLMNRDWPQKFSLPHDLIAGGCAISGIYDLTPVMLSIKNEILNLSPEDMERFSPIRQIPEEASELLFFVGSEETPEFLVQQEEIQQSWQKADLQSSAEICSDRNHIDILMRDFADPMSSMNQQVRSQMGIL
ncbi:MAG: alpha/beta hydrolase [SAR324 cluster bacterium]|nr:alpha/beta hydrolase [SAR324 cluster bacterium]